MPVLYAAPRDSIYLLLSMLMIAKCRHFVHNAKSTDNTFTRFIFPLFLPLTGGREDKSRGSTKEITKISSF